MTLLGILAALALERMLSHLRSWREHHWYANVIARMRTRLPDRFWQSPWFLIVLVVPIPLLVAVIQAQLDGGLLTLLGIAFAILVLVLCLGPRDVGEEIHSYLDAIERGDQEAVDEIVRELLRGPLRHGDEMRGRSVVNATFVQSHERLFGVLFWFAALGPLGAVLYRLASSVPRILDNVDAGDRLRERACRLHAILAWLPVRVTAVLYGLAGSTDDALQRVRAVHAEAHDDWGQKTWRVLTASGIGALQVDDEDSEGRSDAVCLQETLSLNNRALLLLLAVMALMTMGGWTV